MKQLILIFLIIFCTVLASTHLMQDAGYLLILFNGWQIQTSLIVALVSLSLFLLCFHLGYHMLKCLVHLPAKLIKFILKLKTLRQTKHLRQGLEAYYQGDWLSALKKFSHTPSNTPWIVDLMAAQAAQHQGDLEQRDKFLHLASLNEPKARETILLFQSNLQYEQGQYEQAQSTLKHIANMTKHLSIEWYWLQTKLFYHFKSYEQGLKLLQDNSHLQVQSKTYYRYYRHFLLAILKSDLKSKRYEKAYQELRQLPKNLRNDIEILNLCAPILITEKDYSKFMFQKIQKCIKTEKNIHAILKLIEKLPPEAKWLKFIENITSHTSMDAQLYLLQGKIKSKYQLWGAAINDIEKSIALSPSSEAYATLAKVYLELKQTSNALTNMQHALDIDNKD